ncbi:hypothetical protein LIER_05153 [Lithospermum erythrorhizon]|uniref:Uncharacterized protein n=1 Tax=Lithospermum erythrorhizon TaxID=34254 RepID=A0AAV3NZM9_LITER
MNSITAKLPPSLTHPHHPISSIPISPLPFKTPSNLIIKSSTSHHSFNKPQTPKPFSGHFSQNHVPIKALKIESFSQKNVPIKTTKFQSFSQNHKPIQTKKFESFSQNHEPIKTIKLESFSQNHEPIKTKKIEYFSQKFAPIKPIKLESFSENNAPSKTIKIESFSENNELNNTNKVESFSFSHIKTTLVTAVATTVLLFTRFNFIAKPAFAVAMSPPQMVETKNDIVLDEEKEREIEKLLSSNPNDVNALRDLMEIRIKNNKIDEAMSVVDRLIETDPNEIEWSLLKSHLYIYNGDPESAKNRFNEMISKDPLRVEAYHGLVMAASQNESASELKEIEGKIEEAMELAKKGNLKNDLKDFKLLIAQVWVIEGKYSEALMVYEELVKDEPRDFRPYLCQGIIYTLMRKNKEAEKSFEKYRSLVPEGHPYARYFDDNMTGTKLYAQKLDSERAGMKV